MPPVIVAVASAAAYAGAIQILGTSLLATIGSGIIAWGVSYGGNRLLGLTSDVVALDPLDQPDLLLTNTPSNTADIPIVYGQRRMGGTVVFAEVSGSDNQHLDVVYAVAEGEIESLGAAYLDGTRVPDLFAADQSLLTAAAPYGMWMEITLKVAETGSISGSFSGTWDDLVSWASSTYAGTVSVSRGGWDFGELDQLNPQPQAGYALDLSPFDLTTWTDADDPQIVVSGDGDEATDAGRFTAVDILEKPTVDNGWILRIRVQPRGMEQQLPADALASMSVFTQGDIAYASSVEINRHTGADDQAADSALVGRSASWTANHRLQGVAYAYVRYTYDQDVFPRGIPNITWDVKGRKLYDPRSGLTAWSDNPALAILDYLTNARYGRGVDQSEVDLDAIETAANYCDQIADAVTGAKYWTCNGAVLTGRTALENIRYLLTSCRGWLTHASGLYRLVLDAPASPTFTFNEDNITGAWTFHLGDKKSVANHVEAKFFDPAQDYRPDFGIADSESLRAQDNGLLLAQEISLELTNSKQEAYRQAVQTLNQSRQGIVVQFAALPEAWDVLPGDVVYITHNRPGWDQKKFRVGPMRLRQAGDVEVTCIEYSDASYDWGTIPDFDTAPNTNLPSPLHVATPGTPVVTESLYETRAGAGVKAKAVVTWTASQDAYVMDYIVEVRRPQDLNWRQAGRTQDTTIDVLDVEPGFWSFRIQAVNALGVRSEYSGLTDYEVKGLLAPPSTPTGLSVTAHSFLALLTWDSSPDLDVRIGGSFRVRYAADTVVSPGWDDGQDIGLAVSGAVTQVVLPLLSGTYMVKAVDSSGVQSESWASAVTDAPGLWGFSQVGTFAPAPQWTGTRTNTEIDTGVLRLVQGATEVTYLSGEWESTNVFALDQVRRVQLIAALEATAYSVQDNVDARTDPIDLWNDFDGAVNGAASAEVWIAVWDGAAWGAWTRLTAADFHAQIFNFKIVLKSTAPSFNIAVTQLTVTAREVV